MVKFKLSTEVTGFSYGAPKETPPGYDSTRSHSPFRQPQGLIQSARPHDCVCRHAQQGSDSETLVTVVSDPTKEEGGNLGGLGGI